MSFARISLSLVGIAGVVAMALAGGIIWLMMTQPVMVADSVAKGEYSPARQGDRGRALRCAGGTAEVPLIRLAEIRSLDCKHDLPELLAGLQPACAAAALASGRTCR